MNRPIPTAPFDMRYLEGTIGYSIRRAQMQVFADIYRAFGAKSPTLVEFSVMAVTADNPGISQADLALLLAVERPRIVPILDKLERSGWALRTVCSQDRRSRRIHLTPDGAKLLRAMKRRFAQHEKRLAALLGAQAGTLLELLHRVSALGDAESPQR